VGPRPHDQYGVRAGRPQRRQPDLAGIFNTHYWIDPARRVAGLIMTQILPFADPRAVKVYGQFERGIYNALGSA
jgi:hypothetical protein